MVLLALQKMLEWCIPVIITSASADIQGNLPLNPVRNEDMKKLCTFIVENYFWEKYECQNLQSPPGRVINHHSAGIPNPKCGNGSKGQTKDRLELQIWG
eukprot:12818744-Ditylum_brightwellii.AAC.1